MIPRHGLLGGSRPVAAEPLQSLARALPNIHDLHLRDALAMRAANVRAALARGANPAHACRSPLSNAGAWRDYFFAPRRTPRGSRAAVAARDRRPVDGAMRLCRHCSSLCWRAALPPPHRCRDGQGPGVGGRWRGGRVGAEERPEGVVPKREGVVGHRGREGSSSELCASTGAWRCT